MAETTKKTNRNNKSEVWRLLPFVKIAEKYSLITIRLAHWLGSLKSWLSQRARVGSKSWLTHPLKGGEPMSQRANFIFWGEPAFMLSILKRRFCEWY